MNINTHLHPSHKKAAIPSEWRVKDVVAYLWQSINDPSMHRWIIEHCPSNDYIVVSDAIYNIMSQPSKYPFDERTLKTLRTSLFARYRNNEKLSTKEKIHGLFRLNFNKSQSYYHGEDHDMIAMIDLVTTAEEAHTWIEYAKPSLLSFFDQHYAKLIQTSDVIAFIESSRTSEVKGKYINYLPSVREHLNIYGLPARYFLSLPALDAHNLKIVEKLSLFDMMSKKTIPRSSINLVALKSVDDLRAALSMKGESSIKNMFGAHDPLSFYEQQAADGGFLSEFYQFALLDGDNLLNKNSKRKDIWNKKVTSLRNNIVTYFKEHPAEVSQWHKNIHAVLHHQIIDVDIIMSDRLMSVLSTYILSTVENLQSVQKLLDVKQKNWPIMAWNDYIGNLSAQEMTLL